ncbi:MAG TPA: CRTAC1 family protein [Bryobacteraceae bacterium]|nr:CRTAC1 family protein [Bryobacteraceae bacterium]
MLASSVKKKITRSILGLCVAAALALPFYDYAGAPTGVAFSDVTTAAGLSDFRNVQGGTAAKPHVLEVMGGGAAFLDFDNDGKLDILLVRGSTIDHYNKGGGNAVCALYKGDGNGHFTDVTKQSKLNEVRGWGMGVTVADYDNDGWQDILVTGYGRNFLFHNRHDGTFEEVAEKAGVRGSGWNTGAAFGDFDRDGYLDLYIARYLEYPIDHLPEHNSSCNYRGTPVFCGPRGFPGSRDVIYFGDANGHFHDRTAELQIDPDKLYGLGVVAADYDNDGWPDIFVTNDLSANLLYHNLGKGKFEEVALTANAAFSADGVEEGNMGADVADYDHDGWLDMYYTTSSFQTDELLQNNHDGTFTNTTNPAGHGEATYRFVKWGTSFADLDNDGWDDLFVVNGHLYPEADKFDLGLVYKQRPLLFMNNRNKTFREIGREAGLTAAWKSRGLAVGDYDNDGRLDLLINNLDDGPVLLHNDSPRQHWLTVRCVGTKSNRSAVGARLTLQAGELRQIQEIKAGLSYLSANDLRVHFGLGAHEKADWLEVRWPSGLTERVEGVAADQILTIEEGKSKAVPSVISRGEK